jgi:2-polyprenyl-3-methyl-5-hydroxy-6-metoxy-1,4-benzoquinol methylase
LRTSLPTHRSSPEPAVTCACCGERCALLLAGHPGYRAGESYDIYWCSNCDTSQARPLAVDPAIYEDIYRSIERVPAYERYARYERAVLLSDAPLDELAEAEDVYWAIRQHLRDRAATQRDLRLLDAGSGLGYLTHALALAGHDVRGIDISEAAVARARTTFGDHYETADVTHYARMHARAFDAIVMTELIEHVPDVYGLLSAAVEALDSGGALLVTTPNKSSFAADAIWATENPPVHLWWFSERSMRALAVRLGCFVEFVDFAEFNRAHAGRNGFVEGRRQRHVPFFPVTMDQAGNVRPGRAPVRSVRAMVRVALEHVRLAETALSTRHRLHVRRQGISSRRWNMCAVFTRP